MNKITAYLENFLGVMGINGAGQDGSYNYLDMHAMANDNVIEVFSIKKLQKAFPEMDEFTLKDFDAEWRTARQEMLNLKFDKEDFKGLNTLSHFKASQ